MTKRTVDVGELMLVRAQTILQMNRNCLSLDWLKEFDTDSLLGCCERMKENSLQTSTVFKNLQHELIQNLNFAPFYTKFLSLISEKQPDSIQSVTMASMSSRLDDLVASCRFNQKDLTMYDPADLVDVLAEDNAWSYGRLVYLENFSGLGLSVEERTNLFLGMKRCIEIPLSLDEKQKALLREPFIMDSSLVVSATFIDVVQLLDGHADLAVIANKMWKKGVGNGLRFKDYQQFAQSEQKYCSLMNPIIEALAPPALDLFLEHWQANGCPLHELQSMNRLLKVETERDWKKLMDTRSGYTNTLYGTKFRNLDLSDVNNNQDELLLYAISHRKNHFIRLVDEFAEDFVTTPGNSILFWDKFYKEHFNINELTAKELSDCAEMPFVKWKFFGFAPGRQYTFPEVRTLYGQPEIYWTLYNALNLESQDDRLRIFREIKKRCLLSDVETEDIPALAAKLCEKPLSYWRQNEFGHIRYLYASDAVHLLIHYDECAHLIPDMQNRLDAQIALRSRAVLDQFDTMQGLKESLMGKEPQWKELSERMELTADFIGKNRESILDFLCHNGADMALTYMDGLNDTYCQAYQHVVKAQLMGKFHELKYFEGDLKRELNISLPNTLIESWKMNTSLDEQDLQVQEYDDFFSTMLAGAVPQKTCLSYTDGAYRDCLLSGFDSNKKLLYAKTSEQTVGRAYIRFTKALQGRCTQSDSNPSLTFADLEKVENESSGYVEPEPLVLFLERPYISQAGPGLKSRIMQQFIRLAKKKAHEMGVTLAVSNFYTSAATPDLTMTRLDLYISRSKAGRQYLDSLGGQATTDDESGYRSNSFLVWKPANDVVHN